MAIFLYLRFPTDWYKESRHDEKVLARPESVRRQKLREKKVAHGQHVLASFGPNDFSI